MANIKQTYTEFKKHLDKTYKDADVFFRSGINNSVVVHNSFLGIAFDYNVFSQEMMISLALEIDPNNPDHKIIYDNQHKSIDIFVFRGYDDPQQIELLYATYKVVEQDMLNDTCLIISLHIPEDRFYIGDKNATEYYSQR